jgi:threonine/homoserine/homoserine lactone efflux protein
VYTDVDSKIFWLKERLIKVVLWGIFISAFLIGFSGAMMPGPMLGVTIDGSLKKGWTAGPLTVLGHGILEFILIVIMTFGLKDFFSNPTVAGFIGFFGGAFLAWMGYGMIKSGINKSVSLESQSMGKGAFLGVLTGLFFYLSFQLGRGWTIKPFLGARSR